MNPTPAPRPTLLRARQLARPLVLLPALLLGTLACADTPTRGFERFYEALVAGDARVLDELDRASRRQVEEAARSRGLPPAAALAGAGVRSTLRALRERERSGMEATLEVEDALGNTELVPMVLEEGRWRVRLAAPPAEASTPPASSASPSSASAAPEPTP